MNQQEMNRRIDAMSADQWFTIEDIAGQHDPDVWKRLCQMDNGKHTRRDGCLFVGNMTRTRFMWRSDGRDREATQLHQ